MCMTILGMTICVTKAQPQVPAYPQQTPESLLEQARHKALLYGLTNTSR